MPRLTGLVIVGMLTAAILSPVLAADAAVLSTGAETTINVKEACNGPVIDAEVVVKDQAGNVIKQTTVGTQVLIEGTVSMECVDHPDASRITLFEIRTKEGITTYLAWQKFPIYTSGQMAAGLSWTPDEPGEYEVRLFPVFCLNCPMVPSKIVTYEITVV